MSHVNEAPFGFFPHCSCPFTRRTLITTALSIVSLWAALWPRDPVGGNKLLCHCHIMLPLTLSGSANWQVCYHWHVTLILGNAWTNIFLSLELPRPQFFSEPCPYYQQNPREFSSVAFNLCAAATPKYVPQIGIILICYNHFDLKLSLTSSWHHQAISQL